MTQVLKLAKFLIIFFILQLLPDISVAQTSANDPVIKVDFNFSGRKEAEVHEPGYISWPIVESTKDERTFGTVKIEIKGELSSDWYKAGVQAPFFSRWINDGLTSLGPVTMVISGLPAGKHTLLTTHNTFANPEGNTMAPLDIYVNGKLTVDNLQPGNREYHPFETGTTYIPLDAAAGRDIVIRFEVDPQSNATVKKIVLNGFEINTPDLKKQSRMPQPKDGDEHVLAKDELVMKWDAAHSAVLHDLYFGTDKKAVASGDTESAVYKGRQADTKFKVKDLYSMETYYWRVDEVDADGNITKGDVWYFRPAQLAFPGAEGYGRFARGGRGGKVVEVTNLNDSGPGSLREAVTNDIGPRTIVFAVAGNIKLRSRLVLNQPYVTVAGQTAPGKGIMISGAPFGLTGNDGVIRFIRVRVGAGRTYDGMGLTGANHSIIDHCSISWTIDEAFSSRGAHNITLQRTLISEALNIAGHGKYEEGKMHGYAATIGGDIGSFHHNLLAHCYGRNWSLGGGLDGNGFYIGRLDIRNNVVYNWGKRSTDGGAHEVNFVNNYYKPGAATSFFYALKAQHESYGGGTQRYYFSGNVMPGYFDAQNQEKGRMITGEVDYQTYVDKPFFPSYVETQSAREAYKNVLSNVGCNQPVLDKHDTRIIEETLAGTYTYEGSKSGLPGIPDTQEDVGGWEQYPETKRPEKWDTDHDGLPDWWEKQHSLDIGSAPGDFSDANADPDQDGFTNLDLYLSWMANPHYFLDNKEVLKINLKDLFRGFTDKPAFSVAEATNASVKLLQNGSVARIRLLKPGLAAITLQVKDADGNGMSRQIGVFMR